MKLEEVRTFLLQEFPQSDIKVEKIGNQGAQVRLHVNFEHLRPGGTISGPALMTTADCALYVAILSELGPVKLAVTTSLTINFLHRPSAECDVIGQCRLMKIGKRLVVGEVYLYSEGCDDPVAHVVGTYSIPPGSLSENSEPTVETVITAGKPEGKNC